MKFCRTLTTTRLNCRITNIRLIMATLRFFYFYLSIVLCVDASTEGEPRKTKMRIIFIFKLPECPAPADKSGFFVNNLMDNPKSKR